MPREAPTFSVLDVECHAGYRGKETPRRFRVIGECQVEIAEVVDSWLAPDHARHQTRHKRGGTAVPVELDTTVPAEQPVDAVDVLDLDRAITKLESLDPGQARIVELRFFVGLTIKETAAALDLSPAAIKRESAVAKGWLFRELTGSADSSALD